MESNPAFRCVGGRVCVVGRAMILFDWRLFEAMDPILIFSPNSRNIKGTLNEETLRLKLVLIDARTPHQFS